jgi:hypothetical protein
LKICCVDRVILLLILQGWIACGGDAGLLKVLKLETPTGPDAKLQVSILFYIVLTTFVHIRGMPH